MGMTGIMENNLEEMENEKKIGTTHSGSSGVAPWMIVNSGFVLEINSESKCSIRRYLQQERHGRERIWLVGTPDVLKH